jgi:hypothetical protein
MYREYLMARIDAVIESLPDPVPASIIPVTVKWDLIEWMWGRGFNITDVVRRIALDTVDYRLEYLPPCRQ